MTTLSAIEKLVNDVAKRALEKDTEGQDTPLHEKVDALKVLTPYYLAIRKERMTEDTNGESTMDDFAKTLQEDNAAQIRDRRRARR
jgi:hypothetical protein